MRQTSKQRQTAEKLLEEIIRLARGVDHWRDWNIKEHKQHYGPAAPVPYETYVSPGFLFFALLPPGADGLLEIAEKNPERDTVAYWLAKVNRNAVSITRARYTLKVIRQWYSHTASDILYMQTKLEPEQVQELTDYLASFRNEVGFDFFSESGLVRKVANKVLKRGKLANEEEWYLLKEVRDDLSQSILSEPETLKISELMDQFERTRQKPHASRC